MSSFRSRTGVLLAALVLLACCGAGPPAKPWTQPLPAGWRLEEIVKATPYHWDRGTAYVLAWKIMEDDRPLRVEQCLVLKRLAKPTDAGERWVLASVYRHPRQQEVGWEQSVWWFAPDPRGKTPPAEWHYRLFMRRPTNKDIHDFIDRYDWTLRSGDGWKIHEGEVCVAAWLEGVGEKPTRSVRK